MSEQIKKKTGWIRYKICDRSGGGFHDKWVYLPWACEEDDESAMETIIYRQETWAIHAERYSWEIERHATPPIEEVQKEIKRTETRIEAAKETLATLQAGLAGAGA